MIHVLAIIGVVAIILGAVTCAMKLFEHFERVGDVRGVYREMEAVKSLNDKLARELAESAAEIEVLKNRTEYR